VLPVYRKLESYFPKNKHLTRTQISETAAVHVYRPAQLASPAAALVWIHGGGLIIGSPHQDGGWLHKMADELGIVVAAVEYRLAPEHRYPAAIEDCYSAFTWIATQTDIDPARIAVGGGSAGGGLAAATVLAARERPGPKACFQLLVYPMLDDRTATHVDPDAEYRRLWSNKANSFGWSSYLGHPPGRADVSHLAAPARCSDFAGLPPAWIGVGTLDLFHDECLSYASRLRAVGVECTTSVVQGAFHGFDAMAHKPVARQFRAEQIAALRAALN
jgi:acetyl esterase/lipase